MNIMRAVNEPFFFYLAANIQMQNGALFLLVFNILC